MPNDNINITINAYEKKISNLTGKLSIKCTFTVLLVNIGDATPANIGLQVKLGEDVYASVAVGGFSASGTNATGTLSLNTAALTSYFDNLGDQREVKFTLVAQDTSDDDLLCNDTVSIMNNPYNASALPPDASTDAVTVSALPTVADELAVWNDTAGVLSDTGYDVNQEADGLVDSDTAIPTSANVKAVTDANTDAIAPNTVHVAGDGSDHADVATNTADVATNVAGIAANDAAMLKRAAADFAVGIDPKATPVLADRVLIEDSADSWTKKTALVSGIQNTGAVTDAANVTVDASGFSGNLSGTDTDAQTALETVDALVIASSSYDYTVTANDYADLRDAIEGGAYGSIFVPSGTYTVTDDEAAPFVVHADCKLIFGENEGTVIIDADGAANTNITDLFDANADTTFHNLTVIGLPATGTVYAFSGANTGTSYSYPDTITQCFDCQVLAPDGGGNSNCFGFHICSSHSCYVDGDAKMGGFYQCSTTTQGIAKDCTAGFVSVYTIASCIAHHASSLGIGFQNCYAVTACYSNNVATGFQGCVGMSGCFARICATAGFLSCDNMSACVTHFNTTDGDPYNSCDNMSRTCALIAGNATTIYVTCTFVAPLIKDDATVAPGVGDDSDDGYSVGSQWVDTTADVTYFCQDATVGAAVWQEVGSGGGGGMSANKLTAKNLYGGI